MRIAQVAPLAESIPPKLYGGTERVVSNLESGLVDLGHEVTVFATHDSRVKGQLIPCRNRPLRMEENVPGDVATSMYVADTIRMLETVHDMADEFDIIHFHTDMLHMPVFADIPEKTVTTPHWRLDIPGFPRFYNRYKNFPLISITNAQRKPLPKANFRKTIYHGISPATYRFTPEGNQDYLAFLGRFSPEKGADRAINIALKAGVPLKLAAKICTQIEQNRIYYEQAVKPLLGVNGAEYIGEIGEHEKSSFLGGAMALLMPINWPEPFGLVMIEAMACGTPVIATRYGSVPEVVEHGVTGFIVDSEEDAVKAIGEIHKLDRARIRARFMERFSVEAMIASHEMLYRELVAAAKGVKLPAAEAYPGKLAAGKDSRTGISKRAAREPNRRLVS